MKKNLVIYVVDFHNGKFGFFEGNTLEQLSSTTMPKLEWDKIKGALNQVKESGYGVVEPTFDDLILDEPQVLKMGGNRYGVKIKATAPSLHIMRVDVETEVSPMVGSEQQSRELVSYLNNQTVENPNGMLQINMFGRTLLDLVKEGLGGKINSMPPEAQRKMRKALSRMVNE